MCVCTCWVALSMLLCSFMARLSVGPPISGAHNPPPLRPRILVIVFKGRQPRGGLQDAAPRLPSTPLLLGLVSGSAFSPAVGGNTTSGSSPLMSLFLFYRVAGGHACGAARARGG